MTYLLPARYYVALLQTVFLAGDVWSVILPNTRGARAHGGTAGARQPRGDAQDGWRKTHARGTAANPQL